jgi:hypothetical protein
VFGGSSLSKNEQGHPFVEIPVSVAAKFTIVVEKTHDPETPV